AWVRLNSTSSYLVACFLALTLIAPVQPWSADGALNAILILPPAAGAAGAGTVAGVSALFGASSAFGLSSAFLQAICESASVRASPHTTARFGSIIACLLVWSTSGLGAGRRQRRG